VVVTYIDDRDNVYSNLLFNHGNLWNNLLFNHGNSMKGEALRNGSVVNSDASFFATQPFLYPVMFQRGRWIRWIGHTRRPHGVCESPLVTIHWACAEISRARGSLRYLCII